MENRKNDQNSDMQGDNLKEGLIMAEISKEEFKESVVDYLKKFFRRSVEDADQQQLFQAVAYATKDIVIDQWMASHKQWEKEDKKIVYYFHAL